LLNKTIYYMKRILLISFMLMSALISEAWAQRTVSGTVTSGSDGEGLPGVAVRAKGTSTGVTTDFSGNYRLEVPEGSNTLVYSFVGFTTQEIEIGNRSVIDVVLAEDVKQLEEVVVTAMNVSRDKASLGYSQQTLDAEAVTKVKESNFINSLSGKVAGVNVRTNNTMGGSTNITIRGNSSFTNNQPLFVIDGVPVSNETNNSTAQQAGGRGYDYGNPAADINPEDIASMSVLKGAAATALYGSRGQNGVILITTKKGTKRKGIGVSISSGITVGRIDRSTFAEYQNQYGAGYGPYYGSSGYFMDFEGTDDMPAGFVVPTTEDGSYGGQYNPNLMVYHWDSFVPESPNFGKKRPWVAAENSPVEFFETQTTFNNSIALSGGSDAASFRLSYTNLDMEDILPNSSMNKNTINFNGSAQLTDKLSADAFFQYNRQDVVGRFSTGYSDNLMTQFRQWWQTNVDVKAQEDIYNRTGQNYTWNAADYTDPLTPIYWDNPYWTRYENYNSDTRDRNLSKVGATYKFTDWLSLNASASIDAYTEVREERRAVGSVPTGFGVTGNSEVSGYMRTNIENAEYNYNAVLTANRDLNEDLSLSSLLGFNLRKERYERSIGSTAGGLAVPGLYSLSNSVSTNPFPFEQLLEKEVYGYFGNLNLGYRNFLYLDGNYRIDVSSALPVANNQYDYYSLGLGLVFSQLVDIEWLDFGKVRASYGTVGNDTRPLRVNDVFTRQNNFGSGILTSLPATKNNANLLPEETREYEFGLQGNAFDNRVNFDVSYYNRETSNQLLSVGVSRATGYSSTFINAGTIGNKGWEVVLGGDFVRTTDFRFNTTVNFTRNRSEVLDLIGDTENYVFGSFQGGITSNATVGEPFGVFKGTGFQLIDGQRVVNENGFYVAVPDQIIGDPNPDFNMGINNSLSYKGFNLGFLVDWQQGGDVYSLDMHYGQGTGIFTNTVGTNDRGEPYRAPVSEGGGILLPGVTEDGAQNETYARADYYGGAFYWGTATRNPGELTIYDASYVKLREASLTYSLPSNLVNGWAQGVNLSLVGRNLWIIHKNVPYADPESGLGAGPAQGYLSGSYPTVRTVGFKVDVTF
jgi:TonB-linked SusC/RagA family outer membrane protein